MEIKTLTLLLDPHSLVDGVVSPTDSLTTLSDDSTALGDAINIDLSIKNNGKIFSSLKQMKPHLIDNQGNYFGCPT